MAEPFTPEEWRKISVAVRKYRNLLIKDQERAIRTGKSIPSMQERIDSYRSILDRIPIPGAD